MARLKDKYHSEILPKLQEQFSIKNPMAVPKIEKIVVNRGIGRALENSKRLDEATKELATITGQQPRMCRARKSISNFKVREGMHIGARTRRAHVRSL